MLTVAQLAERWNVSERLVYKLVSSGKLKCHRIGTAIRFAEEQVTAYMNRRTETVPEQSYSHLDL